VARWKGVADLERRIAMAGAAERRWLKTSVAERRRYALKMVEARRERRTQNAQRMSPDELKRARTVLGLTQKRLAAKLGMHPITVARWESGARGISERIAKRVQRLLSETLRTRNRRKAARKSDEVEP
jgi:DNA-binding transcriptional regulator YiaG